MDGSSPAGRPPLRQWLALPALQAPVQPGLVALPHHALLLRPALDLLQARIGDAVDPLLKVTSDLIHHLWLPILQRIQKEPILACYQMLRRRLPSLIAERTYLIYRTDAKGLQTLTRHRPDLLQAEAELLQKHEIEN